MDPDERPARFTNNELALLIQNLETNLTTAFREMATRLDGFLLTKVYEADQTTRTDRFAAMNERIDNAMSIARWCIGLTVTILAAMATVVAVVVTK